MTETVAKLQAEIEALSHEERVQLAQFLFAYLDEEEEDPAEAAAFLAELQRRSAEMDSGKVKGIPADQVFADIRAKYQRP